jgi:hypothetical protein
MIGEKILLDPEARAYVTAAYLCVGQSGRRTSDVEQINTHVPELVSFILERDSDFRIELLEKILSANPGLRPPAVLGMAKQIIEIRNPTPKPERRPASAIPAGDPSRDTSESTATRKATASKKSATRKKTAG